MERVRLRGVSRAGPGVVPTSSGIWPGLRGAQTAGPGLPATPAQAGSPDRGCGSVREPRLPGEAAPAWWGRKLRQLALSHVKVTSSRERGTAWSQARCAAAAGLCRLARPAPSASWGSQRRRLSSLRPSCHGDLAESCSEVLKDHTSFRPFVLWMGICLLTGLGDAGTSLSSVCPPLRGSRWVVSPPPSETPRPGSGFGEGRAGEEGGPALGGRGAEKCRDSPIVPQREPS